jgi:SulP family sulfate permease
MVSLLTSATLSEMAEPGSARFIELSYLLALMTGLIQLVLGLLKAGALVNFLSHPVLKVCFRVHVCYIHICVVGS